MRYGITVFGNHETTAALVQSLIADGLKPDLIVTLGQNARQKVVIAGAADDLADWSRANGISLYECDGYRLISDRDRAFFADNEFGIGVCTDWQHLLPKHVLDSFDHGIFGFHGSLMEFPNGRGRSPFNWSIRLGGKSIFHNCFRYTERADDGGVFNTTEIPIGPDDTIRMLQFKAIIDSRITIRRLLQSYLAGAIPSTPQPESASVWLPKLTPEDSRIQFEAMGLRAILDMIRASSRPFAGAFAATLGGARLRIWRASAYDGPIDPLWNEAPVGTIVAAALDSALIKCRDGLMLAMEVSTDLATLAGERLI